MTKNIENKYYDNLRTVISQKNDIYSNPNQVATKASAMISPNLYNFIFMTFKDTVELSRKSPIRKLKNNNIQNDNDNDNVNELKKNRKRKHSSSSGGSKEVDELNIKEKEIENIKASCSEIQESTEKCISKKSRKKEIYESKTNMSNDKVLKDKDKIEDGGESEEDRVNNKTCFGNLVTSDPLQKEYKKRKHEEIAQLEQKSKENQFIKRQSDNKSSEKEFAESSVSTDLSILEENAEAEELAVKECLKNKSKNKLKKHDGKDKLDEAEQNNQSSDKEKVTVNRINEKEEQFEKKNKQNSVCDISTEHQRHSEENMNEEVEASSVSLKENCSDILQISEKKSMSTHFSILSEESEESGDNPEKRIEEEKEALNASEALPLDFPDFCETLNKYIEKTHARSYEESNFDKIDETNVESLTKDCPLSSTVYEERCKVFKQKNNGTFKKDNKQEKSEVNEDDRFDKPGKVGATRSSGSDDLCENSRSLYSKEDNGDVFNKEKKKAFSETRASEDEETVTLKENSKQVVNVINNEILISPSLQLLPKKQIEKHKKFDEERHNRDNNFNQSNEEEENFSIHDIVNDGKEDSEICENNKTRRVLTQFDTDMTTDNQIKKKAKSGKVRKRRSTGSDDLCENNRSLYSKEDKGDVFNKEKKKKASSETRASEDEETMTLKENSKQVVNVINNEILINPSLQLLPKKQIEKHKKFDVEIRNKDNNFNQSNEEEEILAINSSANDRNEDSEICENNKTRGVLTQFDTDMTTDKQIKKKAKPGKVRKRRSSGSDDLCENNRSLYSKEDNVDVFNKKKKKASSETRASEDEETVILKKNSKQVVNVISNEILSLSLQVLPKKQIEKHKKFDEEIHNKDNSFDQSNEEEEIFSINNIVNDRKEDSEIYESNKTPGVLTQFNTDTTTNKQIKKKCSLSQKNITEFFKRKKDDVNEISHFNIESQSSSWKNDEAGKEHNTTTVKKDEKLRKRLIKAVTNKIEKVLLKNKQNDSSYGVEVVVSVKKDAKQTGTNEELLVSYKKCALEEETNVTTEEKEEELSGNKSFDDEKQQETVEEEKYEDDDRLTEKLASLRIQLPWPVPKIHQIETTLTGGPSKHQRRQIAVSGVKLKRGPYTSSEDQIIRNNWDDFCVKHDLPLDSHSFFRSSHFQSIDRLSDKEKLNFVRFLAHGLSDRTLYSVYSRFQKLFLNNIKKCGRFTSEEDKIIMAYMKNHVNDKKPYCQLAAILNRDKTAVFKRHKRLVDSAKGKVKKVRWNRQNVDKFLKHLINVTACKNVEELKERQITTEEWEQISKMINLSVKQLQQFWFLRMYPRLFIEKDMDDHEILNKLLNILTDKNYNDWRNVNWKEISKEFDGCTSQYLYQMFKGTTVRHRVPEEKQHNLRECVEYLRNNYWKFRKYKKRIKLNLDESILPRDIQCDTSESSEEDSE